MKHCICLLLPLVASCGDNRHSASDAQLIDAQQIIADAPVDAAPPHMGVVIASATVHSLTESGEVTQLAQNLVLIDSAGNHITPVVDGNGMLRFEPVQLGPYLVCDTSFVTRLNCAEASAANIDLDVYTAGRLDAVSATAGTSLSLTATSAGGSPAGSGEFFDINVLNTNYFGFGNPPVLANTPVVTALNWQGQGLLTTVDILRATQLETKTTGTETYVAATHTGTTTGITMVDGQTNLAGVALTPIPQTGSVTFNLRRSQFLAIAPPNMTYVREETDGFAEKGDYQFFPWLFQYGSAAAATTDVPLTMTYGVSWSAATAQSYASTFFFQRNVTAPGATTSALVQADLSVYAPISELTGDVVPKITVVRDPKINGLDATVAQSGTTTTPTLSWTAPTTGTPNRYTIYLYRVVNQAGATVASTSAQIAVVGTSFKFPAGFITAGQAYLFTIRAETVPNYDENKPFASVAQSYAADTVTAVLVP